MIIRGGENIQPTEIENYICSMVEVQDCYVIGVPSKRLGMHHISVCNGNCNTITVCNQRHNRQHNLCCIHYVSKVIDQFSPDPYKIIQCHFN